MKSRAWRIRPEDGASRAGPEPWRRIRAALAAWWVPCCLALPRPGAAQELPGVGAVAADSLRPAPEPGWRRWMPLGDLRLRGDFVHDLPNGREDLERGRSFLRLGVAAFPIPNLELGAAFEGALGTDHNLDNRVNNDNEQSDDFNLDLFYGRWTVGGDLVLAAGRRALPLATSAMVWDDDLRPAGGAVAARFPWRDFDAFRFVAGWFGVRSLAESWVRLAAVQAAYALRDGGPRGADARVAYLRYDHADGLVADGLARTNATQGGVFVSDFELLDVQLSGRTALGGVPCVAEAGWVENLGAAASASTGLRAGITIGDLAARGHVEVRYAFQRIEQDAVLAAFDSDDWWFHSRMRGHRAAAVVALGGGVSFGVSGSIERRDDLAEWTERLLLDLRAGFSP